MEAEAFKLLGAGLAAIGAGLAAMGVGNVFAAFLQASGVGEYFMNLAFAAFGRMRGGPAIPGRWRRIWAR